MCRGLVPGQGLRLEVADTSKSSGLPDDGTGLDEYEGVCHEYGGHDAVSPLGLMRLAWASPFISAGVTRTVMKRGSGGE